MKKTGIERNIMKCRLNNLRYLKTFRKDLRNNPTKAESRLWMFLKNRQLGGNKFRRQHSIGDYILDFYCPEEKIGIELDGEIHHLIHQKEYDNEKNLFLEAYGIKVLRFENELVLENPETVLNAISSEFGWTKK